MVPQCVKIVVQHTSSGFKIVEIRSARSRISFKEKVCHLYNRKLRLDLQISTNTKKLNQMLALKDLGLFFNQYIIILPTTIVPEDTSTISTCWASASTTFIFPFSFCLSVCSPNEIQVDEQPAPPPKRKTRL